MTNRNNGRTMIAARRAVHGGLGALVAAAALWSAAAPAKDLVIGVFIPTTGALAPLGEDMRRGYELAAKQAGKINGDDIRIVVEDSQGSASVGLRVAQKLVLESGAKVLVGGASSAVVLAIAGQSARLNVPILTTNSQAIQTTGEQCNKLLFRTNPNDAMMAKGTELLAQRQPELLKKKWFVIFHDMVWGNSNRAEFAKIPGITIVGSAGRPLGTADWSSAIAQIQSSGADAIYLALAVGDDMPAFVGQARSFGLKQMMLPPLGMPDAMLKALGDSGVGFKTGGLFASWMSEDKSPLQAEMNKAYFAAYQRAPGPQAIQAYAGMLWLIEGLKAAKSTDPLAIVKALESTRVPTPIGMLAVRKEDHQGMVPLYMAEAIKLPTSKYGSAYAWKVIEEFPWDSVKIGLKDTGCKGL